VRSRVVQVSELIAVTPQLSGLSGLFRWLGRARPGGRLRGRGDLIQPAQRAQHVRPSVPSLLVLPQEVRRASNQHQVESSAEGKTRGSRHAWRHRCSPVRRYGGAFGGDRREPPPSVWHHQAGLTARTGDAARADRRGWPTGLTPPGLGNLAPRRRSALATPCCRSWSFIPRGIRRSARLEVRMQESRSSLIPGESAQFPVRTNAESIPAPIVADFAEYALKKASAPGCKRAQVKINAAAPIRSRPLDPVYPGDPDRRDRHEGAVRPGR
jgi:hypothetical protein